MKADTKNLTGYCKWFNPFKQFGFITVCSPCEEEGKDIFFVDSDIRTELYVPEKSLISNERVNFDITYSDRGCKAINITAILGKTLRCDKNVREILGETLRCDKNLSK